MQIKHTVRFEVVLAMAIIFLAMMTRFLPHAPNFSPTLAVALFAGAMFADKRLAFGIPLVVILFTDWALGFYGGMSFVYLAYVLTIVMGMYLRSRKVLPVVVAALSSAMVFFVFSNLGVWLFAGLYPLTWAGLVQCYVLAIPFFTNTLTSTVLGSAVLFGAHSFVILRSQQPRLS